MIVATGRMVYAAQQVAAALAKKSVRAGVIDLFRIKPLEADGLLRAVSGAPRLISLEEHFVCGGVGSALAELLVTREKAPRFKAFGIPHAFCRRYGKRDYLLKLNGLDVETLTREVGAWVRGKKS
jgi:transketolase